MAILAAASLQMVRSTCDSRPALWEVRAGPLMIVTVLGEPVEKQSASSSAVPRSQGLRCCVEIYRCDDLARMRVGLDRCPVGHYPD